LAGGGALEGRSYTIVLDFGSFLAGRLPRSRLLYLLIYRSLVKLWLLMLGACCKLLLLIVETRLKPKLVNTFSCSLLKSISTNY
jgi:hypothetical protein